MHQALCILELLQNINIFVGTRKADLAALARTCKTFKEPALDLLWEELDDLSPLVRCLPGARRVSTHATIPYDLGRKVSYYFFNEPLNKAERDTLRSYASRVRFIRRPTRHVHLKEGTRRTIFNLEPSIFPNLRSLYWDLSTTFPARHVSIPSLISLQLYVPFHCPLRAMEFLDTLGDRSPQLRELVVRTSSGHVDVPISRTICHLPSLHRVQCQQVALKMDAITHLSSVPNLKHLSFTAEMGVIQHISRLGSKLVFSNLENLYIASRTLHTVTLFLSHAHLPATQRLAVVITYYVSKKAVQAYWVAAQEACPFIVFAHLDFSVSDGDGDSPDEETLPRLTLEDLHPCTAFSQLRRLHVNFNWHVSLTDADLLHLASPHTEHIVINDVVGWGTGMNCSGVTLSGLVRLLRQCPYLNKVCLAIDTSTFTKIPDGLDVSFPPRKELSLDFVDSYIRPEFVPGVVSVFTTLQLDPSMFSVWDVHQGVFVDEPIQRPIWKRVRDELRRIPELHSLSKR